MKAWTGFAFGILAALTCRQLCRADTPTTQPTEAVQTGELDLTFTERSKLSDPKELARRLAMKPAALGENYDLSQCPFKAYVPTNYDPKTPVGIIVYMGYKNTVSSPPEWHPVLEKDHLIFISSVSHTGTFNPPILPKWQALGLAIDAVHNLRLRYAIDGRRIYLMSWDVGMPLSLASGDVFTGFMVIDDLGYYRVEPTRNGQYYYADFPPPPTEILSASKRRPFFMILADDADDSVVTKMNLNIASMKYDRFGAVKLARLSIKGELHFPNMKTKWFEQQALPFLDGAAIAAPVAVAPSAQSPVKPAATDEADHLLHMAKLYISNNMPDLAKKKLQSILDNYPTDPAAKEAKQLLDQLGQ